MAQYRIYDPEERLECPYNPTCMPRAKRFQYHLIKCRKNYTGTKYEKCPFNATHHVPKPEFRYHLATCPDKAVIEPELNYEQRKENGEVKILKGCTDTPVYRELDIQNEEDWDTEISVPVSVEPQYDNAHFERVQFNNLSREERNSNLSNGYVASSLEEENLRLPRTTSEAAVVRRGQAQPIQQPVSSVFAYSIGRGRGRGRGRGATETNTNGDAHDAVVPIMPYGSRGNQHVRAGGVGRGFGAPKVGANNHD